MLDFFILIDIKKSYIYITIKKRKEVSFITTIYVQKNKPCKRELKKKQYHD